MSDTMRLLIVQPSLAKYRVPVFQEAASRPGVDLRVWYGEYPGITNVKPDGFVGIEHPLRVWQCAGQELMWHQAQIDAASLTDIDAVILTWGSRYLSLGPALRRAHRNGIPVVLWGHGYSRSENRFRVWARNRIASQASALLFYDQPTADAAIASGMPAERVFVAPNAIDQKPIAEAREAWRAPPERLAGFRESNDLDGRRVLLYVSRFTQKTQLPLLIDAISELRRTRPEVLAVLIGDGETAGEVRARIREHGLEDHVRMPGAVFDEHELAPWFLIAEAFVYPSSIGLSLLHALGYGLPVVTDDAWSNHNPEIVAFHDDDGSPESNGLSYRTGNASDLSAVLDRLLGDPGLRQRLSSGALSTIESTYNVPQMVDGLLAAARHAIG